MAVLAGVTFRKIGKLHYYAADDLSAVLAVGNRVVAETDRGVECGEVKILRDVAGEESDAPGSFRLLRQATEADLRQWEKRQKQGSDAIETCRKRADALHLPMKITDAEVVFDGSGITFYFVADTRIDFRQLVKETAAAIKMRVHLHQVGSRDHAQALGGYGPCGRPLCCTTFLRDFAPVSMKMAKDQSLFLNPSKFSGVCGKLMCCLRYEHDVYVEAKEKLPHIGMTVSLPSGERGAVTELNIFSERVTVQIRTEEDTRSVTLPASDVRAARACGDCGSSGGGGCGGSCGSDTCETSAKGASAVPEPIALEMRFVGGRRGNF
ncbi:MAG: stage 0 sporulation protein [Fibrella sp.]|nr:stage 0 sporulation protein [Armatimonadota bacterium]